jgi:outer membrane protein TolC
MKILHLLCFSVLITFTGRAQNGVVPVQQKLTLEEVIQLALQESVAGKQAEATKENSYWQWRTYQAIYKPQLSLSGTLPDFNRAINAVPQPDGTTAFRQVAINYSTVNLSVTQNIGLTGGQIFVTSALQRFDDFDRKTKQYNSNPAIIGISQALFGYNALAWNRKIEPLRYEESKKRFLEEREQIALKATEYFFDLFLQQENADIAAKNLTNNEALYKIAEEKFRLGRLSKNDLLQLQLTVLNFKVAWAQAMMDAKAASLNLRNYIGLTSNEAIALETPSNTPVLLIDEETALAEARKNRKEAIAFKRQLLQAERDVAFAKGSNGFNATLFATFGLTKQAEDFTDSYNRPENQQRVRVGFEMPILDWGKQRSIVKTALVNQKLALYTVEQDQTTFDQTITNQVSQFILLRERLPISAQADDIARQRYEITKATYLIGKISITDLNIASGEKDQAKRAYIAALRDFWLAYYNLRTLTLYDFSTNKPLN